MGWRPTRKRKDDWKYDKETKIWTLTQGDYVAHVRASQRTAYWSVDHNGERIAGGRDYYGYRSALKTAQEAIANDGKNK